ncbi:MAG TPA: PilN domain-containing protein [Phycisphaerae bacterium]|nr:PilN domain-containing protein [Phycisphaerae bacterium]
MTCSVNLIPGARVHARIRGRRRRLWLVTCGLAVVLLATGWGVERTASESVTRLSESVKGLEAQQAEVQRRLVLASAQCAQLLAQLETIGAATRPQPWPRRMLKLLQAAPEGIRLTSLNVEPSAPDNARRAAPPPVAASGVASPAAAGGTIVEKRSVRLEGLAADHGALIQFLHQLQGLPGWERVELVRAKQESRADGTAVAFELDCCTREDQP